ncbi:GntR family transcriptional regulator [Acidimangrovimonas pyrenivorans]|uniref:GntR family transcriptional regulator n=1 Tax=Acidimangrovimonas pyrenivorans TaxID=2030798 RepID=A0ABV7AEF5_9RHOB
MLGQPRASLGPYAPGPPGRRIEDGSERKLSDTTAKLPAHELVYRRLREMILFGEFAPGQGVTIQGITAALNSGMTPVREAIRRLTAEGALEFMGNRRVCVPLLTPEGLDELSFARLSIEPHLARLATGHATEADIDYLAGIDALVNLAIQMGDVGAYLQHNYRFHAGLYELAEAPMLMSIANMLWLRGGPSLRVVCGRYGTLNLPDKHAEALQALRDGDADGVGQAISDDITQGLEQIRVSLAG